MSEKRIFNMNARAEVKLTEYGKEVYSEFYRPMGIEFSDLHRLETLSMPLWELMHIFGPVLWIGFSRMPFHENRIVIEE